MNAICSVSADNFAFISFCWVNCKMIFLNLFIKLFHEDYLPMGRTDADESHLYDSKNTFVLQLAVLKKDILSPNNASILSAIV